MIEDILVILTVAFGLFAISMFVLFYIYLKKNYNKRHLSDDYTKDDNDDEKSKDSYDEYVPRKKK